MSSLVESVEAGDRRGLLEGMAVELARAIDAGPEAKDLAALVLRLERVSAELDAMPVVGGPASLEDRVEARRVAREASDREGVA
jgi:hypothetical protein